MIATLTEPDHESHNNTLLLMCKKSCIVAVSLVRPCILPARLNAREYLVTIQQVLLEMINDVPAHV